jgi:putative CocE/NonD family hydrolase
MWWFDHWLRGPENEALKIPMIRIFILNTNTWRNFNSWPPKVKETKFYLHSKGNANSRLGDGSLSRSPSGEEQPDSYDFNPLKPCPTTGGRNLSIDNGQKDQSKLEKRSDILVYTSEKLQEGLELIGEVKLIFYAASSAKDTDFMVKLVDVFPNGKRALNVLDEGVRARFRTGDLENPSLLEPYKIYKYEINLGSTAIYFPKGHCIRLEISSSNFPRFDINSNLAGETNKDGYKIAHQTIFHDSTNSSYLLLPIFSPKN